jgi:uncharacterized protein (TIGR02117 family)
MFGAAVLVAAVVVLGAIPLPTFVAKAASAPSTGSVRIFVLSNGFHSDIAVPALQGETFVRLGLDADDYPVDIGAVRYWAIGWGSRTAYTSLRKVSDLTIGIVLQAFAFDTTVVHVQPLGEISIQEGVYAFDLAPDDFETLLRNLRNSFGANVDVIPEITQGFGDRFYLGAGRFSPVSACNVWTGRRLREIGIGVGLWTPFAQSLEFGLSRTSAQPLADVISVKPVEIVEERFRAPQTEKPVANPPPRSILVIDPAVELGSLRHAIDAFPSPRTI